MGFILYIISVCLQIILIPIGVVYGLCYSFYDTHIIDGFKHANSKFKKMAIGTDVYGNVYMEELLNTTLITKSALHKFGEYGITISAVLGHNQYHNTLTGTGKAIAFILDKIEKDHCLKAYLHTLSTHIYS